jgi:hypothetical protein
MNLTWFHLHLKWVNGIFHRLHAKHQNASPNWFEARETKPMHRNTL